jgi:23S rRNA pseudouridine1911/1915/1917 synthase
VNLPPTAKGERFDRAIRAALSEQGREVSVREIRRAIDAGLIRIEGKRRAPGDRASGGESIDLSRFVPRSESRIEPEPELARLVRVVFRDDRLLVLDKPSGMATQPILPGERGTLLAAAIAIAPEIGSAGPPLEGGLLHRLDVETSGLVMFAREAAVRTELRRAFSEHRITKRYLLLVQGAIATARVVEGAIAPGPTPDRVRVVEPGDPKGRPARTEVEPIRSSGGRSLVRATTRFGRRHQVRAHLASIGLPILGDRIYGDPAFPRLALHASELVLPDGQTFESPLPEEMEL